MKILIVDDDKQGIYLIETLLKKNGYETVSAENGLEALRMLKQGIYDIIISDILMPKMDGFQLCRKCKTDDKLKTIPFIFYTATYTDKKDEEFALSLGAQRFIVKPQESGKFLEILNSVIEEQSKKRGVAPIVPNKQEAVYLKEYNERLIRKLENKVLDLEKSIIERKKAKDVLQEKERFLSNIFESIQDGISILNKDMKIIRVNKTIEEWYKHASPLLGKKCYKAYHNRDKVCDICPAKKTFKTAKPAQEVITKNGEKGEIVKWLDLYTFPIINERTDQVDSVIEYVRDISERKKAEEREKEIIAAQAAAEADKKKAKELLEANQKLQDTQAQLMQAEKLSAIGRLGAGVAHELNSPLAGLLGLLRIYHKRTNKGSEEYQDVVDMIEAAEHMAEIVQSLTTFSRESKGEWEELNLNKLIDTTLNFSGCQFKRKNIKIIKNYSPDLLPIKGIRSQIQQVIVNIVTNARDAMLGGGKFFIRTYNHESGDKVGMEFGDTGTGIPRENISKIFDPFFTTKKQGNGVGLGLSISHGIIKGHQGEILVKGEEGKGTTFTIILPALKTKENK